MHDRLIAGRVVTPERIIDDGWVAVSGESIAAVGSGPRPAAASIDNYGAAYILPGMIDGQTQAGSQIGFPGLGPTTICAWP